MMWRLLVLLLCWGVCVKTLPEPRAEGDTTFGRLPLDLLPLHYDIELQPDFYLPAPPFPFSGSVDIRFECVERTSVVYLNSRGLTIDDPSISITIAVNSPVQGPDPQSAGHELDVPFQFFKLYLTEDLVVGAHYHISMTFSGTIKSPADQDGIFWGSYESIVDGQTNYVVSTQLEDHGARQTFPSFDEPLFKAMFDITLLRKTDVIALSNMPLQSSEDRGDGWIADTFDTTEWMSCYLVCFTIGDFDYVESFTTSGTPVRIYGRPEYMQDMNYAHGLVAAVQDWLETWTGRTDPMPKVDHIAVPLKGGAMENWGTITYGESLLMYDSNRQYVSDQRRILSVIAHELAHFWFGDLVTCRWWEHTWLNEGFASFFEDLVYDDLVGYSSDDVTLIGQIRTVMYRDSSSTSTAIRPTVNFPSESGKGFSTYVYNKGSGVLRMIRQYLGADTFQRAVQLYLNRHAYGSVETDDFWAAVTEQAEIDGVTDVGGLKLFIKQKMDPWVDQRGYPLVTLTRTGPGSADVTQHEFLNPIGQTSPPSPFQYEWYVPLTITSEANPDWSTETKAWLNRDNKTIGTSEGIPDSMDQWFVANIKQNGFYRVKYDSATYSQIINQLVTDATVIDHTTRYSLVSDSFEITRSGREPETFAFETTRYLAQEDNYLVWSTVDIVLEYPTVVLARYGATFAAYQTYLRSRVDVAYTNFGWDNGADDNLRQCSRSVILSFACSFGNADCAGEARTRFDAFVADPSANNIPPDHRTTVYCTSLTSGTQADWDFLHAQYLVESESVLRGASAEVSRLLTSLACIQDDALLQRYIDFTFEEANIKSTDASSALNAIANSDRGRWVLWDHLKANWNNNPVPILVSKLNLLETVAEGFATAADVSDLENFFQLNPPQDQSEIDAFDDTLTAANDNKAWADANESDLLSWFQTNRGTYKMDSVTQESNNHRLLSLPERYNDVQMLGERSRWFTKYNHIVNPM